MPTVADSFSGLSAAANLSTRSPWVQRSGVLQGGTGGGNVSPNNASADSIYAYNSGSLASNHSSECVVTLSGGGIASLGPAIRISATGDGYAWIVNEAGTGFLNRYAAGVFVVTLFTSGVGAIASGSVLRISANGSTIKVFDDGVELASISDANYSGGSPGLAGFSASTLLLATEWSATDGVVAAMRRSSRRRRRSARGNDRSLAAWSDGRFGALGWFDRDLWRVASAGGNTPIPVSDNATGTDTASIAATAAASDTSSGTDTGAVSAAVAPTDSASGGDTGGVGAGVGISDTAAGADTAIPTASIAATDSATGGDSVSVDQGGTAIPVSDAASWSDTVSLAATVAGSDSSGGADTIAAAVSTSRSDAAAGNDTAALTAAQAPTDTSSGSDQAAANAALGISDSASASDGVAVDTGSADQAPALVDSATGSDFIDVVRTGDPAAEVVQALGGGTAWPARAERKTAPRRVFKGRALADQQDRAPPLEMTMADSARGISTIALLIHDHETKLMRTRLAPRLMRS